MSFMENNPNKISSVLFFSIWVLIISICAFFIVYNASWLVGDDAIVMRHTGFGHPFMPKDFVIKEAGRFYPFSYLMYNILLIFGKGWISPEAHYTLHSICFIFCIFNYSILAFNITENRQPWFRYAITLLVAITAVGRFLPNFLECYSTVWFGYYLSSLFILLAFTFFQKQVLTFGILALLVATFSTYRSESSFIMPLAFGSANLLFNFKRLSKAKAIISALLIVDAIIYLTIYATSILPYTVGRYDGSHGSNISFISNAINIIVAQKIILISIPFALYKLFLLAKGKSAYGFFDSIYLTALAMCCGGFILKLNWVLYYNTAAIFTLFFILSVCMSTKMRQTNVIIIFAAISLLYGSKITPTIINNQKSRIQVPIEIAQLSQKIECHQTFWLAPDDNNHTESMVKKDWIETQIAWATNNERFKIKSISDIDEIANVNMPILFFYSANDSTLIQNISRDHYEQEPVFQEGGIVVTIGHPINQ